MQRGYIICPDNVPEEPTQVFLNVRNSRNLHHLIGTALTRRKPLFCGVSDGGIQTNKRSFGVTELSRAVAPGHHLRRVHHFHLILQPRELGFHVIDLELDDSGAIGR